MKTFNTLCIVSFLIVFVSTANAQKLVLKVGSNPTTIDAKAILEIESTTKGLLLPRMTTVQRNALSATVTTNGMQVYDTTIKGICVFNGTVWECSTGNNTGDNATNSKNWSLTGNTGTNPAANFIGTTDAKDLVLGTNGLEKVRVSLTARLSFSGTSGGNSNLFIGGGNETTAGLWNVALGKNSLINALSGNNNTAIGNSALENSSTGASNTAIGSQALASNSIGSFNTALGHRALINNIGGSSNTVIGGEAGITINTGSNNTIIGYNAAAGITDGANNTILGANVTSLAANLSNNIILADGSGNQRINVDSNGNVGVGITTPATSALIDMTSTASGFAMPRMTNTQRKAIAAPIEGLQVYDTTLKGIYIYDGLKWDCANNPAGSVNYFANSTAPNGYLECNGQLVNRNTYAELFAAIGIVYGAGNGSTTFNLPDLRGEFVRGLDKGRGVDAGRTIGSKQKATIVAFDNGSSGVWTTTASDLTLAGSRLQVGLDAYDTTDYSGVLLDGATSEVSGEALPGRSGIFSGTGVIRPRNLALLPCIKF